MQLPCRFVAITSWTAATLCVVTIGLALKAANFNIDAFGDPMSQFNAGPAAMEAIKWSMICDIYGFYLLCVPAAIYLWFLFRNEHPFAISLATVAGLFYILIGSIGAGILSILWPALASDYFANGPQSPAGQASFALFKAVTNMVYTGMWGRVEYFLNAVWYWGAVWVTWHRLRAFSVLSIIGSGGAIASGIGEYVSAPAITEVGMSIYIVVGIAWITWVGVLAWRRTGVPAA